ncbi:MAG: NAD-dependent epimerase/dehydratase family protein [Acidobacteria bacterium]|nr:NAD-dependent epimerase/dehydratase family protein [Acidobacteriota bacterium]
MRALVTGAAGFVGSHLSDRLLEQGHEVVGIDCFTDYYPRAVKETNVSSPRARARFTFVESRIQDASWTALLDGVTHVFHLAAQAGVRSSWGSDFSIYTDCNIEATQVLLEACLDRPLERFVYASSSSVYGDDVAIPMHEDARPQPLSPYGVTKLAAEHLCMLYHANCGVPAVALRYFTVYGPRQRPDMAFHRFLSALLADRPISLYGDGEQTRDFTFIEDAVAATVAAGARGVPGSVYNVGGGSRVSVHQGIDVMASCSGRTPDVPRRAPQRGAMRDTVAATGRARVDLEFVPRVTLEKGIHAEYQWLATSLPVTP